MNPPELGNGDGNFPGGRGGGGGYGGDGHLAGAEGASEEVLHVSSLLLLCHPHLLEHLVPLLHDEGPLVCVCRDVCVGLRGGKEQIWILASAVIED